MEDRANKLDEKEGEYTTEDKQLWVGVRVITAFTTLFVVGINFALLKVIREFTIRERHNTFTAYNLSVALKLTAARFINTAVIPIMVNFNFNEWMTETGLIVDVWSIFVAVAF